MKKKLAYTLLILLLLPLAAWLLWPYLPYQGAAEREIRNQLEGRGLKPESLEVLKLDTNSAELADIRLEGGFAVKHAVAEFSIRERALTRVEAEGVELLVIHEDGKWKLGGLQPLLEQNGATAGNEAGTPLPEAVIRDIRVTVKGVQPQDMVLTAPLAELNAGVLKVPDITVLKASGFKLKRAGVAYDMNSREGSVDAEGLNLTVYRESGNWRVAGLEKLMAAKGGATADAASLPQITVRDTTVTVKGLEEQDMVLKVPHAAAEGGVLTFRGVETSWGGGGVGASEVKIPLSMDKPIRVVLRFQEVDLEKLLKEAAAGKVKGTGKISGTLPVTWHPGGRIDLAGGVASALAGGLLSISAEALPETLGDVRAALANFQYHSLNMKVDSEGERTVVRLTVEGASPDAFNGRPVKLNVNLTGDIIPLLKQTVIPMGDPMELLKNSK